MYGSSAKWDGYPLLTPRIPSFSSVQALIGLGIVLSMLLGSFQVQAITTNELRVAWFYTFAKHTRWPNDAQRQQITIGFYPAQPELEALLRRATHARLLRDKPIVVVHYADITKARQAQMLVLGADKNSQLQAVASALTGSQTLLVSEEAPESLHTMINLKGSEQSRLTFEVHRPNIVYEGLDVGRDLLLSGGTELDVARIYKESERALVLVKDALKQQAKALQLQETVLTKKTQQVQHKTQQLLGLRENIEQLQQKLQQDQQHLDQNKHQLQQDKSRAELNQLSLDKQQLTLKAQQFQVDRMALELKAKLDDIGKNTRLMAEQEVVIDEQIQRIRRQGNSLESKSATIAQQQDLLGNQQLLSGGLGVIVLLTLYGIYSRIRAAKQLSLSNQELAESNNKLAETSQQLRSAAAAKSMFLSTMSHEIRTPMNGVLGMAELLASSKLNAEQQRNLGIIQSSGKLLVNVINDILDYSKIEAGKMELENIDYEPDRLLQDCATTFGRIAQDKALDFTLLIDPDVPATLQGDPSRITQVLTNFLSNAFKFTEQGEVRICAELLAPQQVWRFSVQDSGRGMSEAQCASIFNPFTQADVSINRSHGGTGLGLSICKQLVELMGGEVGVESHLGQGSCFWSRLPVSDDALMQTSSRQLPPALEQGQVLVAIEHADQCANLCGHLRRWGIEAKALATVDQLWESLTDALTSEPPRRPTILLSDKLLDLSRPHPAEVMEDACVIYLCSRAQSMDRFADEQQSFVHLRQPVNASMIFDALQLLHHPQALEKPSAKQQLAQYPSARVLVAEDNQVNQMVVKGLLKQYAIEPVIAENGQLALEALIAAQEQSEQFDLVLMDCEMPLLDGYEASRMFRDSEEETALAGPDKSAPHTAIVALTAHAMTEHRDRAKAAGMDDHLAKPINRGALEEVLARFCAPST